MKKKIIIKNGTIINYNETIKADILISDNKIKKISCQTPLEVSDNFFEIIDAKGKYIFPGAIDPHVHFNLPTFAGITADDFYTGSLAALAGGTTTVIDFVTPQKDESLVEALKKRKKEAEKSLIDVFFHVSPILWNKNTAKEMEICVKKYGVKSFKIYTAYKNNIGINDDEIIKVLQTAKKLGVVVNIHCENDEIINFLRKKYISEGKTSPKYHALSRPDIAEAEAINRLITYAEIIDTTIYIVHVSTKKGIELIEQAQKRGVKIYAETCPHYLLLNDSVYNLEFEKSAKYVLSPPLRKKVDNKALWDAISKGVIQTVGTDHCSFNLKGQKDKGSNDFTKIANGAGSVEHRLSLLYTYGVLQNRISINKMIELLAWQPAKIFGLSDRKGAIKVGYDADIVIWNPDKKSIISKNTHKQNCDNNIYEGFEVFGEVDRVLLGN